MNYSSKTPCGINARYSSHFWSNSKSRKFSLIGYINPKTIPRCCVRSMLTHNNYSVNLFIVNERSSPLNVVFATGHLVERMLYSQGSWPCICGWPSNALASLGMELSLEVPMWLVRIRQLASLIRNSTGTLSRVLNAMEEEGTVQISRRGKMGSFLEDMSLGCNRRRPHGNLINHAIISKTRRPSNRAL